MPAKWHMNIKIATLIGVALCTILCLSLLASCKNSDPHTTADPPYFSWENFTQASGRYLYAENGNVASKTGVDVSDHQGFIDWQAVRKDGIAFTYIRLGYRGSTEGELYQDAYYQHNMAAAKEAGLERGVYFFSQAITTDEAREEAQFVLELLQGEQLDYPVAFDFEMSAEGIQSRVASLNGEEASAIAKTFCETIYAGGYNVCLYGNSHDLGRYSANLLEAWPIWYAEYGALPSYSEQYILWQFTSTGTVKGIDTPVDLNLDLSAVLE